jgi:alkyldihydroxyacetonephosphate synthase
MSALIDEIRTITGSCVEDPAALRATSRDSWLQTLWWTPEEESLHRPLAIARPVNEEQVCRLLSWAHQNGMVMLPRGGGTGSLGAAVPEAGWIILDTSLLRAFAIGQDDRGPFVKAGAGWAGGALEAQLNASGLSLCHFPDSMAASTVGGWIATRSFGQLSMRYGGIEQQALSVRAVYPGGEALAEEPSLHLGTEGTISVLTEATLRCRKTPGSWDGAGVRCSSLSEALGIVRRTSELLAAPTALMIQGPMDAWASGLRTGFQGSFSAAREALSALALRSPILLDLAQKRLDKDWILFLLFEDVPEGTAGTVLPRLGVQAERACPELARRFGRRSMRWDPGAPRRSVDRRCFADVLDVWSPFERLPALESSLRSALAPYAFVTSFISHFDPRGACLQMTFAGSGGTTAESQGRYEAAWRAGHDACVRFGVRAAHHRGIGLARLPWIRSCVDPAWHEALRQRKAVRDPNGILNPKKLML